MAVIAGPQQKGKKATKGAKQIVEENVATLNFYRNMAMVANAVSLLVLAFYYSGINIALYFFSTVVYIASYQFMAYMAKAKYTETGQLIDSGVDLNMEGGLSEYVIQSFTGRNVKDVVILTAGCQLLAIISNYFWFLWLLAPVRLGWIVWKHILSPYFFQEAPQNPEVDEKKQKKLERKQKRMQVR